MSNRPTDTLFPQLADRLDLSTNGTYWILDDDRTLNWSMSNGLGDTPWSDQIYYRGIFSGVFETVSAYADVDFDYWGSFATPELAYAAGSDMDISIYKFDETGWAAAMCNFPYSQWETEYKGSSGDMYINGQEVLSHSGESSAPGSWNWSLFMHELGHGLGLKHPHDDGGTGRPTFSDMHVENFDSEIFTIMSYQPVTDRSGQMYSPATPMFLDVLALQELYGKNMETNSGNNTHYLEINNQFQTIWDASGADTVDASLSGGAWEVQLPNVQWSDRVDTETGYAYLEIEDGMTLPTTLYWLMGAVENVEGSKYDDRIFGNSSMNRLKGNSGDDQIDGGEGTDYALFNGVYNEYSIEKGDSLTITSTHGSEGSDSLTNVERLMFADRTYALDTSKGEIAGGVYRLYKAAFDRSPDDEGLTYWISHADNGLGLQDIATYFLASQEFSSLYGSSPSSEEYVESLYVNALGRSSDPEGYTYWVHELENGALTRAQLLLEFSESDENVSALGTTIGDGFAYDFS